MTADPADPLEAEGVLNPGTAWGPDDELYLYPRVVAEGNVSRIARARVIIEDGVPTGVERLGLVLSPDEQWEHGHQNAGVEDPRITFLEPLGLHVMTYIAYGPAGATTGARVLARHRHVAPSRPDPVRLSARTRDRPEPVRQQGHRLLPRAGARS